MAMSVDGLVSGLNTTDMINQLMQVEALPQTALKNKVTAQNKAVAAFQAINTKLAALTTAAQALEAKTGWSAVKATSSSDGAIVTTTAQATPGSATFRVDKIVTAQTVAFLDNGVGVSDPDDPGEPVIAGVSFTAPGVDGNPVTVNPATRSLEDVKTAINARDDLPFRASVVQVPGTDPAKYTLQLTAVKAGTAGTFAAADLVSGGLTVLGNPVSILDGGDAQITAGDLNDPAKQYVLTSNTNTFTDVLPGVNVTVTKVLPEVTISTAEDREATADKVQALVDAANAALKEIKTATAAKNGTTAAGALAGDPTLRALGQEILSAVATGAGPNKSLAAVGITVERDGTLAFKRDTFSKLYSDDPGTVWDYFNDFTDANDPPEPTQVFEPEIDVPLGIAHKLSTIGLRATEGLVDPDNPLAPREGIVTGLIKRRNETIASLNDQVEAWDVRLETRRAALQRQYSALEVALGKLKEQQSWLSGQLAGLS
jgi:flagellar hook-associated protein 2